MTKIRKMFSNAYDRFNSLINDKLFFKSIIFSWVLIKKNIFFWFFLAFFIVSQSIVILIINFLFPNIIEGTLFISLIPLLFLLLCDFILVIRLFSESKNNNIDFFFLSLPIKKTQIFLARFVLIFFISFISSILMFLLNTITIIATRNELNWILFFFISNLFITSFINILFISILVLFAILFKKLWFLILSMILFLFLGFPTFLRNIEINNNEVHFNVNNRNNFSKLVLTTNKKTVETFIVDEINLSYINDNKGIIDKINSTPVYNYFVPGEIILTFDSMLAKNFFSINENKIIDKDFSLLKNRYNNYNFSNFSNDEYLNALVLRPTDLNPLTLDNVEYENILMECIDKLVANAQEENFINLTDKKYVQNFYETLLKNPNWKGRINTKEINTLKAMLGINTNYYHLFYFLRDFNWLEHKTPNLLKRIKNKYGEELAKLFTFLWNNEVTKSNLYNTFLEAQPIFPNINDIYPTVKTLNLTKKPTNFDINFIKNDLIRYENGTFSYLDLNGNYIATSLLNEIDPSIVNQESWISFVDKNVMSVNQAKLLINNLSSKLKNLSNVKFSDNEIDIYKYSYFFVVNEETYLTNSQIYVTALIFITIGMLWVSIVMFNKNNYKNFNIE